MLVDEIAKRIDPGAYSDPGWRRTEDGGVERGEWSELMQARINYRRAQAVVVARDIIMALVEMDAQAVRQELIDHELAGWTERGLPTDDPEIKEIIERKYAVERA